MGYPLSLKKIGEGDSPLLVRRQFLEVGNPSSTVIVGHAGDVELVLEPGLPIQQQQFAHRNCHLRRERRYTVREYLNAPECPQPKPRGT